MYTVNKDKCIGCGICEANCPEGVKLNEEAKAEIINQEKVKECGGKDLCPYDAFEEN